jgi:hypothetical protein
MAAPVETFEVDTELTRDALACGVWTRLCCELRGRAEGYHLHEYIGEPTEARIDTGTVMGYLEADMGFLTAARQMLAAVGETPLGSKVQLDDIHRFMPRAWDESTNRWLWAPTEISDAEETGGRVVMVREFGSNESLRRD